ncbi:MAG: DUF2124 domain-containing protein [Methanospirillum sp.]|nr:DUF2124 domain-containing protein [Methanospirillum sp.]
MEKASYQGIPGILRPFKEYIEQRVLSEGSEIVFYGVPGTCTPFVELLSYAIRSVPCRFIFVPLLDEEKAHELTFKPGIGFQSTDLRPPTHPAVLVIMGGLAMPGIPVDAGSVCNLLNRWKGTATIGVCFMHMFRKAGWLDTMSFDLLIDAEISVETEKK